MAAPMRLQIIAAGFIALAHVLGIAIGQAFASGQVTAPVYEHSPFPRAHFLPVAHRWTGCRDIAVVAPLGFGTWPQFVYLEKTCTEARR